MLGGSVPSLMEEKFHSRVTVKPKQKHRGRTASELGCGHENAFARTSILEATHQSIEGVPKSSQTQLDSGESIADQDVVMEHID